MITKIFRNGNSLAVRIPASIAIGSAGSEVEIIRRGNNVTISPRRRKLSDMTKRFAAFDADFLSDGRERGAGFKQYG